MSIVHMYGFDHLPERGNLRDYNFVADGFEDLGLEWHTGYTELTTVSKGDRKWLALNELYVNNYGNVIPVSVTFLNRSGGTAGNIFKNPTLVTKGVVGFRLQTMTPTSHFLTSGVNGNLLIVDGERLFDNQFQALTGGEHYIEIEFDFVKKSIGFYLNGGLVETVSVPTLSLNTKVTLGPRWSTTPNSQAKNILHITDIYATYDNEDGDVSGRLGPVVVKPLFVNSATVPEPWELQNPNNITTYRLNGGGTWKSQTLLPKDTSELNIPNGPKLSSASAANRAALVNIVTDPNSTNTGIQFSVPNPSTDIILSVDFENPKEVAGYALSIYNSYLRLQNWQLQGKVNSADAWITLDERLAVPMIGAVGVFSKHAYKLPVDKVGIYRHVRLRAFNHYAQTDSRTAMISHFQLLGEIGANQSSDSLDILSRTPNNNNTDFDFPVIKTDIVEGEATYGFKIPDVGPSDILAVDVGITARREQASSEHIVAKYKIDEDELDPVIVELQPHSTKPKYLGLLHKSVDGTSWTQESLEKLRIVIKSKKGAK